MQATPGHIIRVLRHALKMSQREFAHALGWAPSTISRWERDEAPPSSLALKTILAFAEERGVRYKPRARASARAMVPLHDRLLPGPPKPLEAFAPPPPLPISNASGSRRDPGEQFLSITAERPRWRAEANFRLSSAGSSGRRSRAALHSAGIIAAGLCVVLTIGLPGQAQHVPPPLTLPEPTLHSLEMPSPVPGSIDPVEQPLAPAALSRATTSDGIAHEPGIDTLNPAPVSAASSAPLARLESIVMIGDRHRATFRTETAAITVTEGGWLAGQHVEFIGRNHVELVSSAGETRTVRIGTPIPLE